MTTKKKQAVGYWDAEYDAGRVWPVAARERFVSMLLGSGWKAGEHGVIEGVFPDKPAGERSLTSVRWVGAGGRLAHSAWAPLESLTVGQLVGEARDVVDRRGLYALQLAPMLVAYYAGEVTHSERWVSDLIEILRSTRETYPEYTPLWSLPTLRGDEGGGGRLMKLTIRPGWGSKLAALEMLRQGG